MNDNDETAFKKSVSWLESIQMGEKPKLTEDICKLLKSSQSVQVSDHR